MEKNNNHYHPQAVLWDMDGVLVQTDHLWKNGFIEKTKEQGHIWRSEDTAACRGRTGEDIALHLSTIFTSSQARKIVKEVENFVASNINHGILSKNVVEVLTYYYNKSIPMAVVTSSLPEIVESLEKILPLPFFKEKITSKDVSVGKPNPQGYYLAAQKLGVEIKECLIFEDSDSGIQAALSSGAHVIAMPKTETFQPSTRLTIVKDVKDWHERYLLP